MKEGKEISKVYAVIDTNVIDHDDIVFMKSP